MKFDNCFPAHASIPISLGATSAHDPVYADMAAEGHWIITGRTRSGKSILAYNLLRQLGAYQKVRVIGSDKSGVLLVPFTQRVDEPRICLSPTDIAAHYAVLAWAVEEMNRRNVALQASGRDKWGHFTAAFPLIVVVIEEFPGLIRAAEMDDSTQGRKPAEKLAPKIRSAIETLAAEAAKAGIRLVLIAQRADAAIVGGPTRSNFSVRITHRLDEPEGVRMLHPGLDPETVKEAQTFESGAAFIETAAGGLRIFRGDYLEYEAYTAAISRLHPSQVRA